ncbi:MAG: ACT domain-containing protein [Candidatus Micrarchaeota archaeon]
MKELCIVTDDRVGLLADISETLGKKGINIESIDVEVTGNKAVCRILTSGKDEASAKRELERRGFKVLSSDILVIRLSNRPGELSGVARILADKGVNVTNVHLLTKTGEFVLCAMEVDDNSLASELLARYLE